MTRFAFAVVAALGVVGSAQAQYDIVNGSGAAAIGTFGIGVKSGPLGEPVAGYVGVVSFDLAEGYGTGIVYNLCVSGSRAVANGPIDSGFLVGSGFVYYVEDRAAAGLPDLIQIEITSEAPTRGSGCPAFAMTSPSALTSGHITVVDALPLSTPADQLDAAVPCAAPVGEPTWKNHGHYMRTVAHEVESMVAAGTITEDEGDALVSDRAQNACGK